MVGHIKIDRKILNWEWYSDYKMVHLFLHLLIKANWVDGSWRGTKINRGQHMTSIATLSASTGLSVSQIRTCLNKLQLTGEITSEMTSINTLITICKYDIYQSEKKSNSKQNDIEDDKQSSKRDSTPNDTPVSNNIRKQENKNINKQGFDTRPLASHFNGLPESKIISAIEIRSRTKGNRAKMEDVSAMWEAWKIKELNGHTYYANIDKVYGHFIDWFKFQDIKDMPVKTDKLPDGNQVAEKYSR